MNRAIGHLSADQAITENFSSLIAATIRPTGAGTTLVVRASLFFSGDPIVDIQVRRGSTMVLESHKFPPGVESRVRGGAPYRFEFADRPLSMLEQTYTLQIRGQAGAGREVRRGSMMLVEEI